MQKLSTEAVLTLSPDSELGKLLRASELNLAEVLTLLSLGRDTQLVRDALGLRFLCRDTNPGSMVLLTHWHGVAAVEERIEREFRRFDAFGVGVDWTLFPSPAQADLAARLARRGLKQGSARWLIADLDALPTRPAKGPNLRVAVAESAQAMDDWRHAFGAGFAVTDAVAQHYHDSYVRESRQNLPGQLRTHYVAYVDDRPVACAMLLLAYGVACIWDVATAPEHRRQGYAGFLTRTALEEAKRKGHKHATLLSSRLGHSVYVAAGFRIECNIPEYRWLP